MAPSLFRGRARAAGSSFSSWAGDLGSAPVDGVRGAINIPTTLTIVAIWALSAFFAIPNASLVYGKQFGSTLGTSMTYYALFIAFFVSVFHFELSLLKASILRFAVKFIPVFLLGAVVIILFFHAINYVPPALPSGTPSNGVTFFTTFFVAFPEEIIFRDFLPYLFLGGGDPKRAITTKPLGAQFLSAIIFGLYHMNAYGGNWHAMLFAMVAGFVFGIFREGLNRRGTLTRDPDGLAFSIGMHAMYDAAVFGAFYIPGVTNS